MDSDGLGTLGEVRAEQYLVEQGCRILARNAAFPGAEIDCAGWAGDRLCRGQDADERRILRARGRDTGQTKENMQGRAALHGSKWADGAAGSL